MPVYGSIHSRHYNTSPYAFEISSSCQRNVDEFPNTPSLILSIVVGGDNLLRFALSFRKVRSDLNKFQSGVVYPGSGLSPL